jgi:hypothetical protein
MSALTLLALWLVWRWLFDDDDEPPHALPPRRLA